MTLVGYSSIVSLLKEVAEELIADNIHVEVVDLRTLDPMNIDYDTLGRSLKKTGRMLIVEQAPASAGIAKTIAAKCQETFFDYLDAPILSIGSQDVPLPVSKHIEAAALPQKEEIKNTVKKYV